MSSLTNGTSVEGWERLKEESKGMRVAMTQRASCTNDIERRETRQPHVGAIDDTDEAIAHQAKT